MLWQINLKTWNINKNLNMWRENELELIKKIGKNSFMCDLQILKFISHVLIYMFPKFIYSYFEITKLKFW